MNTSFANRRRQSAPTVAVLAILVLLSLALGAPRAQAQGGPWQAKYWNNRTLSGTPVLVRQEPSINYDWGDGSPAPEVSSDNFSAEWKQTANLPAGTYRFTATFDDGMRVWVDNTVIIDSWYDSQQRSITADVYLGAGNHTVTVQYYEAGGMAVAKMSYALASAPPPPPTQAWRGEYFNNTILSGTPALVRDDANINFEWGYSSPGAGVQADNFSVRWTRTVNFDQGKYRFTAVSDDGMRVWVNSQLIIDSWQIQTATARTADLELPTGAATIRVEYFDKDQLATARFSWSRLTTPPPPTGSWQAEYFNNTNLAGAPVLTRSEASINYNWGTGSPAPQVNNDNFSARWASNISTQNGVYRFTVTADDGVRVFVNDRLIIDAWKVQPATTYTADVNLAAGSAAVRVEYFEYVGLAEIRLTYTIVSGGGTGGQGQFPGLATVNTGRLNVRTGPGPNFPIITKLNNGTVVALTGFRNPAATWIQIITPTGVPGWVNQSYMITSIPVSSLTPIGGTTPPPPQPPPPSGGATGVVIPAYLNVRVGPSTSFQAFATLRSGTVVQLIGRDFSSTWLKIIMPDGRQGWSSAFYINPSLNIATLPVLTQ